MTVDNEQTDKTHFAAKQCIENAALCDRMAAEARDREAGHAFCDLAVSWRDLARLITRLHH